MKYPIDQDKDIPVECQSCTQMCAGRPDPAEKSGMIYVFCGTSQDRNQASTGLVLEAAGEGKKVLLYSFIKKDEDGTDKVLNLIPGLTKVLPLPYKRFAFMMDDEEREEQKRQNEEKLAELFELAGSYDMLCLYDVFYAVSMGLLGQETLIDQLRKRPQTLDVVLTGREAPDRLLAMAEYVTEVNQVRHPRFVI